MSCCGDKRSQWSRTGKEALDRTSPMEARNHSSQAEVSATERDAPIRQKEPRLFEYVGRTSLAVTGASTRRLYPFAFPGDRLEIAYEDSFAIMAESDLKRV
jgi:hypothetical protein